jgi:hypothetical protein
MTIKAFGLVSFILLAMCLTGCITRTTTVTRSSGGSKSDAREVKYSLDGNGGISGAGDASTVTFAEGKVVVEKARVLVNDKEAAKIPEATKLILVDYTAKTLTVTADGAKVHEEKFGK